MAIKSYDTKEAVPEAQRAGALELANGKWVVDEPDEELADAGKQALERTKERVKAEKKRADDAEAKAARLEKDAQALKDGLSKEALDKRRADEDALTGPLNAKITELTAELRKKNLTDALRQHGKKAGWMDDREDDAIELLEGKRVDLADDGVTLVVKDKNGTVTTEPIEKFLKETLPKEKAYLYKGTNSSGSSLEGSDGGGGGGETGDAAARGKAQGIAERKANTEASSLALR